MTFQKLPGRYCAKLNECSRDLDCPWSQRCRLLMDPSSGRAVRRCRAHRRTCRGPGDCSPCDSCQYDPEYGGRTCQRVLEGEFGLESPCEDDGGCFEGLNCVDNRCQHVQCFAHRDCPYAEEKCVRKASTCEVPVQENCGITYIV